MSNSAHDTSRSGQAALAIAAAVLLGIAAVLTAWSAYRESLTSDLVLKNYSEQQATLSLANDSYIRSGQERQQELSIFLQAAVASSEGNIDLAEYLTEQVMSEEVYAVFTWWLELPGKSTPPTPFVPENPAFADLPSEILFAEGQAYDSDAESFRLAAEEADATADRFDLANVFFAVVLFVAGLATVVQRRGIQIGFLVLGSVGLIAGLAFLISTPGAFALG